MEHKTNAEFVRGIHTGSVYSTGLMNCAHHLEVYLMGSIPQLDKESRTTILVGDDLGLY